MMMDLATLNTKIQKAGLPPLLPLSASPWPTLSNAAVCPYLLIFFRLMFGGGGDFQRIDASFGNRRMEHFSKFTWCNRIS